MKSSLDVLNGCRVGRVEEVEDYLQICFDIGAILTILNPISVEGPASISIVDVVDAHLVDAQEEGEFALLRFNEGTVMRIDLRDEAFSGPEAMTLYVPGHSTVVWT